MTDLRRMAEEIAFPGEKWAPLNLGARAWKGPELAKAIEAFGLAVWDDAFLAGKMEERKSFQPILKKEIEWHRIEGMKAAYEDAAKIADNYDLNSPANCCNVTADGTARNITYDIRQRAKEIEG